MTLEIEGRYQKGRASVDEYLEQTAIANPHVKLVYNTPEGETREFPRTIEELPPQPREIKPHPYGIELGMLLKMLQDTKSHSLAGFLAGDFSRVSSAVAEEICKTAGLSPSARPRDVHGADAEELYKAIQSTKIMAPPTNCLSPIGEQAILSGLYKQIKGEFYTAVTRPPAVYRGNPFVIEAGLAFGEGPSRRRRPRTRPRFRSPRASSSSDDSELARVIRYANRVPLLYQQSACAIFKAVLDTAWRNYGVAQSRGALPAGPMVIFVHMASVWVPFTSESKEAIADYDEIGKEIKLALQECGRRLGVFLRRRERAKSEFRRRNIFELYIEEVVEACNRLKGGRLPEAKLKDQLQKIAMKRTGGEKTDEILGHDGGPGGPARTRSSSLPRASKGEVPVVARRRAGRRLRRPPRREQRLPSPRRGEGKARQPGRPKQGGQGASRPRQRRPGAKPRPERPGPRRRPRNAGRRRAARKKSIETRHGQRKLPRSPDRSRRSSSAWPTRDHGGRAEQGSHPGDPGAQPLQHQLQREARASSRWASASRRAPSSTSAWRRSSCRRCSWPMPSSELQRAGPHHLAARDLLPHQAHDEGLAREHASTTRTSPIRSSRISR